MWIRTSYVLVTTQRIRHKGGKFTHCRTISLFFSFFLTRWLNRAESLKSNPGLYITLLVLPFGKQANTGPQGPLGARGNYLERVAMLQVEGGMLITLVDSQDAASSAVLPFLLFTLFMS